MDAQHGLLVAEILKAVEVVTDQFKYERTRPGLSEFTLMMGLKLQQLERAHKLFRDAGYEFAGPEPEKHTIEEWRRIRAERAARMDGGDEEEE